MCESAEFAQADPIRPAVLLAPKIHVHEKEDVNRGQTIIEAIFKDGRKEVVDINRGPETPSKLLDKKTMCIIINFNILWCQ